MKKMTYLRSYLKDESLKITIQKDQVSILNYQKLGGFDAKKVVIISEKKVTINGENLVVSKLMDDEVLISGDLKNIELE